MEIKIIIEINESATKAEVEAMAADVENYILANYDAGPANSTCSFGKHPSGKPLYAVRLVPGLIIQA